jgi:hypothetical protein
MFKPLTLNLRGLSMYYIILLVLGAVGVTWLLIYFFKDQSRDTHAAARRRVAATRELASPFPAVSVRCTGSSCEAAKALKGQRFLAKEAPGLPLRDCSSAHCTCKYAHHFDRRSGTFDRRLLAGASKDYLLFFGNDDPREGRGRRASDWAAAYQMNQPTH